MSQSECVLSFERYEKRITKNMRGIVQGRREGDDVVTINTSVRYSVSDLLRRGYVKKPVDEAWLKEVICQSRVNTNTDRLDKAGGVEANAWHAMSKKYWITINDVLRMPPGKPIKLLALDRNVWDTVSTVNKRGVLYTPAHFFRLNTVIYWRSPDGGGIGGQIKFGYDKLQKQEPWEFDIDTGSAWFPLRDGAVDYEKMKKEGWPVSFAFTSRNWTAFPRTTPLG